MLLKLLPKFFVMARPEGLRFTSSKFDSNFSHRNNVPVSITFIVAHRNWGRGVGGSKWFSILKA
ncbi:MAG TPA: hypothetical protein VJB34_01950 [Bdellovibrionota bacterium]|nr:hypothetical protein [Bdellovibrionota bacterium]